MKGYLLFTLEAALEIVAFSVLAEDFGLGLTSRVAIFFGSHFLALALILVGLVRKWDLSKPSDQGWAVTGICLCLPLPLIGFVAFTGLYAFYSSRPKGTGELLRDFEAYIAFEDANISAERRTEDADRFIMEEVDIAPLRDLLQSDDTALKRGAILSLARLPKREAVALLRSALADDDREIRYLAGNAISEMEREFNDHIFRLLRYIERAPTRVENHLRLAALILDYVDVGLLEPAMVKYFAQIGLEALDKAIMVGCSDPKIYWLQGRLHRICGQLEQAEHALRRCFETNPADLETVVALAEVAYARGNLALARRVVAEARARFPDDERLVELQEVLGRAEGVSA